MDVDAEKVQQAVLALLHLNTFDEKSGKRAWNALPWSVMDQLHDKGYISDPATRNKSVWLSDEGARLGRRAIGRGWIYGSRAHHGRSHQPSIRRVHVRADLVDQCALFPRRCVEDSLRPFALQGVRKDSPRRGMNVKTDLTQYDPYWHAPRHQGWA